MSASQHPHLDNSFSLAGISAERNLDGPALRWCSGCRSILNTIQFLLRSQCPKRASNLAARSRRILPPCPSSQMSCRRAQRSCSHPGDMLTDLPQSSHTPQRTKKYDGKKQQSKPQKTTDTERPLCGQPPLLDDPMTMITRPAGPLCTKL